PEHIYFHGQHGMIEHVVDAGDSGQVNDDLAAAHGILDRLRVEHIATHERNVLVRGQLGVAKGVAVPVIEDHYLVVLHQARTKRRSDEASSTRYENFLILHVHFYLSSSV